MVSAIRLDLAEKGLTAIEDEIILCCETMSEKKKKALFTGILDIETGPIHYIGVFITPAWLVWSRWSIKTGTVVSTARLKDVQITEFQSPLIDDSGLEVTGIINNSPQPMQAFIGADHNPAGEHLRQVIQETTALAANSR
jgi:hypothetical protein